MGRLTGVIIIFLLFVGDIYSRIGFQCPPASLIYCISPQSTDSVVLTADSTLYFIVGEDSLTADSVHHLLEIDFHSVCGQIDTLLIALPADTISVKHFDVRYNKGKMEFQGLDSIYASKRIKSDSAHVELPIIIHSQRSTVDFLKQLKSDMVLYNLHQPADSVAVTDTLLNNVPEKETSAVAVGVLSDSMVVSSLIDSGKLVEDTFNTKFISAVYESDTTSLRRLFTGFDKDGLMKAWVMYRDLKFGEDKVGVDTMLAYGEGQFSDGSQASTLSPKGGMKYPHGSKKPQSVDEFIAGFSEAEKNKPIASYHAEGVVFFVQVSAAREKVSEHYFKSVYKGELSIREHQEDGWYKYQVGETTDYSQARKTLQQIGVNGAFIVAYQNNTKVNLWSVLHHTNHDDYFVADSLSLGANDIVFGIQISASRGEADPSELKKVPAGTGKIYMVVEDGWHKYLILAGRTMSDAKALDKRLKIKGAFIVAYYNGKRIPTKEAIQIVKKMKVG
jgi:hypothetical protein